MVYEIWAFLLWLLQGRRFTPARNARLSVSARRRVIRVYRDWRGKINAQPRAGWLFLWV